MLEAPQSFAVRQECEKATWQNGFRQKKAENDGWIEFTSTNVPGSLQLAAAGIQGPWFLALDH